MATSDETTEFYEHSRGDMSLWSEEPTRAEVRRGGSVVFSLRFTKEELTTLRNQAAALGINLSQFIRRAAMREARQSHPLVTYGVAQEEVALRYFWAPDSSSVNSQASQTLQALG